VEIGTEEEETIVVEPLEDPVPREEPLEPSEPLEAPAKPARVEPVKVGG
jgi:hypothetical protein